MLKGWIDGLASNAQQRDAEKFLLMLKGADDDVIGSVAISAWSWCSAMKLKGTEMHDVAAWAFLEPLMPEMLIKSIKQVQRIDPANATGIMVWLHTVRAALHPELRHYAREIWAELARAPSTIDVAAAKLALELHGAPLYPSTFGPPIDFEPIER